MPFHLMAAGTMNPFVFADAPPCVAFKHNPCSYTPASASHLALYAFLAAIIVVSAVALGWLSRRRKR